MNRRLYFLLPDEAHAREIVTELEQMGIGRNAIHAMSRDGEHLERLPAAEPAQQQDRTAWIERLLWNGNLTLFFIALAGLVVALFAGSTVWMVVTITTMLVTFLGGARFATHVPNTHISSFHDAMSHGQILLMVDIPFYRVREIESTIHRHHRLAESGGSCWQTPVVG